MIDSSKFDKDSDIFSHFYFFNCYNFFCVANLKNLYLKYACVFLCYRCLDENGKILTELRNLRHEVSTIALFDIYDKFILNK